MQLWKLRPSSAAHCPCEEEQKRAPATYQTAALAESQKVSGSAVASAQLSDELIGVFVRKQQRQWYYSPTWREGNTHLSWTSRDGGSD